jgi:hypothetical protein
MMYNLLQYKKVLYLSLEILRNPYLKQVETGQFLKFVEFEKNKSRQFKENE